MRTNIADIYAAGDCVETWRRRLTGDRVNHRLLGARILGHRQSELSKRIDIIASAIYNGMHIDEINDLDLSCKPPLSGPWDPIQLSAQAWIRTLR